MPPTYQRAAHWVKSSAIIFYTPVFFPMVLFAFMVFVLLFWGGVVDTHLFLSLSILYHIYLSSQGLCTENTDINEYKYSVRNCTLCRTHCKPSSPPPPSRSTRCGLSGIWCRPVQRVQRPGVCAVCGLRFAVRSGALDGAGVHRRGIQPPPSPARSVALPPKKIKKAQKSPCPYCQFPKFRRKNKKTPTKGLCSVLYLPYKP